MGIDYTLCELDATRLAEALRRLGERGGLTEEKLRATFADLGGDLDAESSLPDESDAAWRFECALTALLGDRTWFIEGTTGFRIAARAVADLGPEFAAVGMLAGAAGDGDASFDVALPAVARDPMGGRLCGIWSPEALRRCGPAVQRLDEPEALKEIDGAPTAVRTLDNPAIWQEWSLMRDALACTLAAGTALAFICD